MKTKFVFLLFMANIIAGNAQFFVEGDLGVDYTKNKIDEIRVGESSVFLINFSPQFGYWLNDNFAIGTKVILSKENAVSATDPRPGDQGLHFEGSAKTSQWRLSAFGRYKLLGAKKFSLLLDGSIYYDERNTVSISESETTTAKSSMSISKTGVHLFPMVSYSLTEKFNIIVACNFLSMDLYYENNKGESIYTGNGISSGSKGRTGTCHFDFNAQSTIFSSLANIRIGFIYNF